jgi:hypothetical protein
LITAVEFRRLALEMPGAQESSHFETPDFRVGGKIFATLREAEGKGMLKLTAGDQAMFGDAFPAAFTPGSGYWGAKGWTAVILAEVDADTARHAITLAWRAVAPEKLVAKSAP